MAECHTEKIKNEYELVVNWSSPRQQVTETAKVSMKLDNGYQQMSMNYLSGVGF